MSDSLGGIARSSVVGGSGNDRIITGGTDATRGALEIDLSEGGTDTVLLGNDEVGNTSNNTLVSGVPQAQRGLGGAWFDRAGGVNNGESNANTLNATIALWDGTAGTDYAIITGFSAGNGGDRFAYMNGSAGTLIGGYSDNVSLTTNNLSGLAVNSVIEVASSVQISDGENLGAVAVMLSQLNNVQDGNYYVIIYDGTSTHSNAWIYAATATEGDGFDFADTDGATNGYDTDTVELIGVLMGVGADNLTSLNFISSFGLLAENSISIATTSASKAEGNLGSTLFTFTVSRTGDTNTTQIASWAVSGTGANAATAADFVGGVLPSGTVSFAAGEASKTIAVEVAGDSLVEADEGFTVTLSNPSTGLAIGAASANGIIQNDDAAAEGVFGSSRYAVMVSGTPISWTDARARAQALGGDLVSLTSAEENVYVFNLANGVNGAWNFESYWGAFIDGPWIGAYQQAGSIEPNQGWSWVSGEALSYISWHPANPDNHFSSIGPEDYAHFNRLTAPYQWNDLNNNQGRVISYIVEYPLAAAVSLAATSASKAEGNTGSTPFTFTATRTGDTSIAHTASWAVSGSGTNPATAADFVGGVLPTSTLIFAAGETSKTITVNVAGDASVEADEGFTITLSNPSAGLTVGTATATGTIINDDASVSIAAVSASRAEGQSGSTPFTFTATRTGDTSIAHTASWAVSGSGSNAAAGTDFVGGVLPTGTVSFGIGQTSQTITVNVAGDTSVEADEGFAITLSNPSAGLTVGTATATGTIINDDASVSIAATSASRAEGNAGSTPFTFTATRTGDTSIVQTADWAVSGSGTNAAAAADFVGGVLPTGTVSFGIGVTSQTITVNVVGDTQVEASEGFTITLSNASTGLTVGTATATGSIINDDASAQGIFGSSRYTVMVTDAPISWTDARASAQALGGDLASITTAEENIFVYGIANSVLSAWNGNSGPWIGGRQLPGSTEPNGGWIWVSGEAFTYNGWFPDQPDNFNELPSDYISYYANTNGLWHDAPVNWRDVYSYIVEYALPTSIASITATSASKAEGNTGSTPFTFTATRTGDTSIAHTASWAVSGSGTNPATAADFVGGVLPTGTVSFAAGETSKTITVNVLGETSVEASEGFTITLSNASAGLTVGTATATGTIINDDASVAIAAASASKAEGNTGSTPFTFTATRTGDTSIAHTASWAVSGSGTNPATAADFAGGVLPTGTVSFGTGQTSQTITVQVAGDTSVEADESFTITLSNPSAGLVLGTSTDTGTILNDDSASPSTPSISGVVYHWKSHALLSGVTVSAESSSSGSTSTALQFRDVRTDASGNVLVDLWGNGASGVGNFGADLSLGAGINASFQSSLPGDWSVLQNGGTGSLSLAGFGLTSVSGSTKLGTLTFTKSSAATPFNVSLQSGEYGSLSATPLNLASLSDVTGADGAFQIDVGVGTHTVDASRGVGDVGRAITSADALAALRLAVGLNPNSDPDGAGPLQPMRVSPYQFLAADVNNSGTITSVDALIILRMAVRLADAPQAEWLFLSEHDTFWNASTSSYSVTRSAVPNAELPMSMQIDATTTQNLVGVLTGDVNGSWRPLDGNGNALADGAYPALPDSYFVALSGTLAVPTDLWGI